MDREDQGDQDHRSEGRQGQHEVVVCEWEHGYRCSAAPGGTGAERRLRRGAGAGREGEAVQAPDEQDEQREGDQATTE